MTDITAHELAVLLDLEPLPVEGGLFRQTWRGPERPDGKPAGTAIVAMWTDEPDSFSAMHRLPTDEVWHFQLGDPVQLLLLWPDGTVTEPVLGPDIVRGQHITMVVPAGVWMGASLLPGGRYGVFACTMAPGFTDNDYEGGGAERLQAAYPTAAARIDQLVRPETDGAPAGRSPRQVTNTSCALGCLRRDG
jgi:uncharacterized protein